MSSRNVVLVILAVALLSAIVLAVGLRSDGALRPGEVPGIISAVGDRLAPANPVSDADVTGCPRAGAAVQLTNGTGCTLVIAGSKARLRSLKVRPLTAVDLLAVIRGGRDITIRQDNLKPSDDGSDIDIRFRRQGGTIQLTCRQFSGCVVTLRLAA